MALPDCIRPYATQRIILPFLWRGQEWRVPFYQVYAQLKHPVAESSMHYKHQRVPVLKLGRYDIPLFDPCHHSIDAMPDYAVVLSHVEGNRFGLYAYPADRILPSLHFTPEHYSLSRR